MRYLAYTSDFPAILVVQGVADITFDYTAWVNTTDRFQAKRTAMFLHYCKLYLGLAPEEISPLRAGREIGPDDRFDCFLWAIPSRSNHFDGFCSGF